jgi:hypothetical protein
MNSSDDRLKAVTDEQLRSVLSDEDYPCVVFGSQILDLAKTDKLATKFQKLGYNVYFYTPDELYMLRPLNWKTWPDRFAPSGIPKY